MPPAIGDIIDIGSGEEPRKCRVLEIMPMRVDVDIVNIFDGSEETFIPGKVERRVELLCEAVL